MTYYIYLRLPVPQCIYILTHHQNNLLHPTSAKLSLLLATVLTALTALLLRIPDFLPRPLPPRPSLQDEHRKREHNRRLKQDPQRRTIPTDRNRVLRLSEAPMIHEQGATNQLPNQLLPPLPKPVRAVELAQTRLEALAQRAREDAAADGAAEGAREAAERAQQARGDVVRLGRREVQQVRERVVERAARAEPVGEHDGHVEREGRVLGGAEGEGEEADAEEREAEDAGAPEAAGAANVEGLEGVSFFGVVAGSLVRGWGGGYTYADEEAAETES